MIRSMIALLAMVFFTSSAWGAPRAGPPDLTFDFAQPDLQTWDFVVLAQDLFLLDHDDSPLSRCRGFAASPDVVGHRLTVPPGQILDRRPLWLMPLGHRLVYY